MSCLYEQTFDACSCVTFLDGDDALLARFLSSPVRPFATQAFFLPFLLKAIASEAEKDPSAKRNLQGPSMAIASQRVFWAVRIALVGSFTYTDYDH